MPRVESPSQHSSPRGGPDVSEPAGHWILPSVPWLARYFERTCDRVPDNTAVSCGAVHLSYAELDRRANQLARLLRARGAGPGASVGILLERSPRPTSPCSRC